MALRCKPFFPCPGQAAHSKLGAGRSYNIPVFIVWCLVSCVDGFSSLSFYAKAQVSGLYEVRVDQSSPSVISVQMVYGDAMLLSCEGAEEFIPTDFKEKCCNAYGAICSPGKIEAEYPAMFPLAPDYFQFWSGGDGKESAARFQLPAEKGGDRYRTLFSIGCRYPNNQVKSIDVTVSASNYRPNQEDQLTPPPSDPSDESREVPPSRPDDKPSDTFTRSTTTTRASVNREERGSSSGAMPIRFSFSTLVNAVVFFVLYQ